MESHRPALLTFDEVAQQLNLTKNKLTRLCRGRQIPHILIDKCIRFDPEQISRWLAEKEVA